MSIERHIAKADLGLFIALAIPGVGGWLVDALLNLNQALSLPGRAGLTGLSPLLLGLMGVLGVGFAWARLGAPVGTFRLHAIAVKTAAAMLFLLAVMRGAPAVLLMLAAVDAVAAILLLCARSRR